MTRRTSTDYAHPHRPAPVRLLDRAGRLLGAAGIQPRLEVDALLDAARTKTKLHDFGDPAFEVPLRLLVDSIEREAKLTPTGRLIMRGRLVAMLVNRLRLEALYSGRYRAEIEAQSLRRPIVIAGLQRTGTTLLHRLLAADPRARALASWEALSPVPLPGEGRLGNHKRRAHARTAERALRLLAPDFFAIHPVEADAPEEDILLLDHAFTTQAPEATLHVPSYAAWLERADVLPSYRLLARMLRALSWQRSADFWVLKTPHHLEFLRELLTVFPDAVIVQTHRDPQATLPSFCSMVAHGRGVFSDDVDPREVGRHWLRKVRRMLDCSIAVRDAGAMPNVVDVSYYDLVSDPIGQVRRIQAAAGLSASPEAEARMRSLLAQSPQHRHGRHVYRIADFGLSPAMIEETFADYRARFAIERERAPSDGAAANRDPLLGFRNPVSATLSGVLEIVRARPTGASLPADVRLDGKTALVTGATSGLGHAIALDLGRRGARLILPARSGIPEVGRAIASATGAEVVMLPLDLADLGQVAALADELARRGESIDIVVCNAGVMPARSATSRQGHELMFAVHYLANHLLVRKLLELGVVPNDAFAKNGRRGSAIPRIILVSSESHRGAPELDFEHFGAPVDYGPTDGMRQYGYSKLALTTFASELERRLGLDGAPTVAVHTLCPGPVDTRLAREAPALVQPLVGAMMKTFFRSPARAAEPVVYLAAAPELAGETGVYLHMHTKKAPSPVATNPDAGRRLWAEGEALLKTWL